jgi:NTE family protein
MEQSMTEANIPGKTLVLGGGGLAGLGWFAGLFYGLSKHGVVLCDADRMIGTSAGSATAAQLRGPHSLEHMYARQTDPALIADESPPSMAAMAELMAFFPKLQAIPDHAERMRAVGQMALNAKTVPPEVRHAMIERRLSGPDWPKTPLTITAVDVESGALVTFDATSGVSLIDAVAASCAVPGVWPAVAISGKHYIDGGVFSVDNAALAHGAARVIIASPFGTVSPAPAGYHLTDAVSALEAGGSKVLVIEPDAASRAAMGANPLDPAVRKPSAEAGLAQGRRIAGEVETFWSITI